MYRDVRFLGQDKGMHFEMRSTLERHKGMIKELVSETSRVKAKDSKGSRDCDV